MSKQHYCSHIACAACACRHFSSSGFAERPSKPSLLGSEGILQRIFTRPSDTVYLPAVHIPLLCSYTNWFSPIRFFKRASLTLRPVLALPLRDKAREEVAGGARHSEGNLASKHLYSSFSSFIFISINIMTSIIILTITARLESSSNRSGKSLFPSKAEGFQVCSYAAVDDCDGHTGYRHIMQHT